MRSSEGFTIGDIRCSILSVAALLVATAGPLTAQDRSAACREVLQRRFPDAAGAAAVPDDQMCFVLAVAVGDALRSPLFSDGLISPRDLQPTSGGDAATGGSPAQGEPVPTVQPMAIGGGTVAAVGSDAGTDAITALTINPGIFFTTPRDREETARLSRLSDVTVFFPVNELDRDNDGDVDYFGARVRLNWTGLSAGRRLMERARTRFAALMQQEATDAFRIAEVLSAAPNVAGCVDALLAQVGDAGTIIAACGEDARPRIDAGAYEQFRADLAEIREEIDAKYFGLDLRLDVGDPTLGAVPDADATALTGGFAFGRRFVGEAHATSLGFKGRVGARYTDLANLDENSFAVDGGLAFDVRRPVDDLRSVTLSGGFEFRFGDAADQMEALLQTDFLVFRASLSVPITSAAGVSINVGAPLIGEEISPTLSINANWALLLPELASLVR